MKNWLSFSGFLETRSLCSPGCHPLLPRVVGESPPPSSGFTFVTPRKGWVHSLIMQLYQYNYLKTMSKNTKAKPSEHTGIHTHSTSEAAGLFLRQVWLMVPSQPLLYLISEKETHLKKGNASFNFPSLTHLKLKLNRNQRCNHSI